MNKIYATPDDAVADIPPGAFVAFGGFFTCGTPTYLTKALAKLGVRDLTIIIQSVTGARLSVAADFKEIEL